MIRDIVYGHRTIWVDPVNLYGCRLGEDVFVGPFTEIQEDVTVGDRTRIQSHSFICSGVTIGTGVFVGHHVVFTNDRYPRVGRAWELERTVVEDGASIGSGAVILPGIVIGQGSIVGAGSVVTKDVPAATTVKGNPAR